MKHLVVIAIEEYQDAKLPKVAWAGRDADALIAALQPHGYAKAQQHIYRNDQATKTRVQSQLRRLISQLTSDDELAIYFVGAGFAINEENFLAAWDTLPEDLEETSIRLGDLLRQLRSAKCRQMAIFLDVRHGSEAGVAEDELKEFADAMKNTVVFAACGANEESHSGGALRRGIWSYHLTEALAGRIPLALERGHFLTADSLQGYLLAQVPRTIGETFTDGRSQTPGRFGAERETYILADVTAALSARALEPAPEARPLPRATFRGETSMPVKRLSGYQPQYKVPKAVDRFSQKWVQAAGAKEVEGEIDEAYASIRDAMSYKRRDLTKSYDGGASGTVVTPDFDYNISLQQDPQSPGEALIRREVTHIRNPAAVLSETFQKAFPGVFDTIAFSTIAEVDVAAIIDRLEELEPAGIELLNYDDNCTFCKIRVEGIAGIMTVTKADIAVVSTSHQSPRELAQMFVKSWNALLPVAPGGMLLLPGE